MAHSIVLHAKIRADSGHGRDVASLNKGGGSRHLERLSIRHSGAMHRHTHGVGHELGHLIVPVRARPPEVGDGGHDDTRIAGTDILIGETQPLHDAGAKALDQNVGLFRQVQQHAAPRGRLEIERHAPLIGIQVQECAATLRVGDVMRERPEAAGQVSAIRPLHLQYLGAVISQQLGAKRSGNPLG